MHGTETHVLIIEILQLLSYQYNFHTNDIHRAWLSRKLLLDQCLNLEQFNHEAEQAESWMAKREAFLASGDVGSSLDAVQVLIKKHEDFEKSLQAQVGRIM